MIPSKTQWSNWSLPSKYSAIAILIAIVSLVVAIIPFLDKTKELTATEYAGDHYWYLDAKLTAENFPKNFKKLLSEPPDVFKDQLIMKLKDAFGEDSKEYAFFSSKIDNGDNLLEALLASGQQKLIVTDDSIIMTSEGNIKEMHSKPVRNEKGICSDSSSIEFKQMTANIINVTSEGIAFKIPSQSFVEHSNFSCNTETVNVDFLPGKAIIKGSHLIIIDPKGLRSWAGIDNKKVVRREDVRSFYTTDKNINKVQ